MTRNANINISLVNGYHPLDSHWLLRAEAWLRPPAGCARAHISQLYITLCHSPPASQSAHGTWRGDVIAVVASHALLPSCDDVMDFSTGVSLNFIYLSKDFIFHISIGKIMVREHDFSYNCKVIPPSNKHVFVVRDHFLLWYHNLFPPHSARQRLPSGYRRPTH